MNRIFLLLSAIILCSLIYLGCGQSTTEVTEPEHSETEPVLGSVFAPNFHIGAAVNRVQLDGTDTAGLAILEREFTSITPENVMKWENIQPEADRFDWRLADAYVELGQKQDKWIVGHTLVWHSQLPDYVKETIDPDQLRTYLKEHIEAVAGRYKGKIDGWDVLNEALNEDGSYRESVFYQVLGEQYIVDVFRLAQEVDPNAELYYNDYNLNTPEKRQGAIRIVRLLQENDVRIDGIGMQAHYNLNGPPISEVRNSIDAYAATGTKVMITELDLTVLPNPWDLEGAAVEQNFEESEMMNPYAGGLPDSVQIRLADRYEELFQLFLEKDEHITRVTFWGVHDVQSWLNGWPIRGRTNYPLLFDRQFQPKIAHERLVQLAANQE